MGYSCYPESGLRWWHVVVFFGFVVLVADIASMQMLGPKTNQFTFPNALPATNAHRPALPLAPEPHEAESLPEVAPPPRPANENR